MLNTDNRAIQCSLFQLLGLGLGFDRRVNKSDFRTIDQVIDMAIEQDVVGFVFDGYQQLAKHGIVATPVNEKEAQNIARLFGYANLVDTRNKGNLEAIRHLTKLWKSHNIKTIVLKGIAYGQYYPNPLHRSSSDFDCYLFDDQEKGNQIVEQLGVNVDRSYYKNSKFIFERLTVENHSFMTQIRGMRNSRSLERYLIQLLKENSLTENEGVLYPPPLFNAIYMIRHAQCHFLREGFTLKHVCDWLMFQKANKGNYDEKEFNCICERHGMIQFVCSLTHLGELISGSKDLDDLDNADRQLLNYIFHSDTKEGKSITQIRWKIIKNTLHSGWKYRLFSNQSHVEWLIKSGFEYLFIKFLKL